MTWTDVVVAWLSVLLGLTGMGTVYLAVVRLIRSATGGLR